MRLLTIWVVVALTALGPAVPRAVADTESGGLRGLCLSLTGDGGEWVLRQIEQSTAKKFEPVMQAAIADANLDYGALGDEIKQELRLLWDDSVRTVVPPLMAKFCALYDSGDLPGLGPEIEHGYLSIMLDLKFVVEDGHFKLAEGDCKLTYQVIIEQDESQATTKYVFCESGGSLALASALRADPDGPDGWRKID